MVLAPPDDPVEDSVLRTPGDGLGPHPHLLAQVTEGLIVFATNREGLVRIALPAALEALDLPLDDVLDRPFHALAAHPDDVVRTARTLSVDPTPDTPDEAAALLLDHVLAGNTLTADWTWRAWPARELRISFTFAPLRETDGSIVGMRMIGVDVTGRYHAEQLSTWLATHDPLTRLPNRALLSERAEELLRRARACGGRIALLFIDLDGFKPVNDTLGHHAGDELLRIVASRLRAVVGPNKLVARHGGDEFLVLVPDIETADDAIPCVERILAAIESPFPIAGQRLSLSCSVGVTVYPEHGDDFDTLLRHADAAMYQAKDEGRGTWRVARTSGALLTVSPPDFPALLRRAMREERLRIHYQPLLHLDDSRIWAVEALVRWLGDDGTLRRPPSFLEDAEAHDLVHLIDEWVLREATRALRESTDPRLASASLCINLSFRTFTRAHFADWLAALLHEERFAAERLIVEIREVGGPAEERHLAASVAALRAAGVRVTLDHFGGPRSSLSSLRHLAVDAVKVDSALLADVAQRSDARAIVRGILALATELGIEVVLPGIESPDTLPHLESPSRRIVQGNLFAPALPLDELPANLGILPPSLLPRP